MDETYAPNQGLLFTVAFECNEQRFLSVIPMVCINTLNGRTAYLDFQRWMNGVVRGEWQSVLATDCWVRGWKLDGMMKGRVRPWRESYQAKLYKGAIAGDSDPSNTSQFGVYYNAQQARLDGRTACSKTFFGPCPEAMYSKGEIVPAHRDGFLQRLTDTLGQGFTDEVSHRQYKRVLARRNSLVEVLYPAQMWFARAWVASQRRRAAPHM